MFQTGMRRGTRVLKCWGSWQEKQGMESKARPTVQSSTPMLSDAGPGAGDAELLENFRSIHEALGLIPRTVV